MSDPLQLLPLNGGGGGEGAPSDGADDGEGSGGEPLVQRILAGSFVQMLGAGTSGVQRAATHGLSGSSGSLPFGAQIQRSFGRHDVSGVRAHTDAKAGEGADAMNARAFASGNHVAFGGAPDLHTAAHEAAHVVQQAGGVQLKGGVGEVGDRYERNADAVADAVVRGESAESLLDPFSGGASGGGAVQLEPKGKAARPSKEGEEQSFGKLASGGKSAEELGQGQANKGPELMLTKSDEYHFEIDVPITHGFAVHAEVTAELGKDTKLNKGLFNNAKGKEQNTVSTLKLNVKLGGTFTVLLFKIGVGLFGQIEAEVEGDKGIAEMVKTAARESVRFFAADKVKGTADNLKKIGGLVVNNERQINGIINPLLASIIFDRDYTEANRKEVQRQLTKEAGIFEWATALDKIKALRKSFQKDLMSAASLPGEDAEKASGIVVPFDAVIGEMNKMSAAMNDSSEGASLRARKSLAGGRDNIAATMNKAAIAAQESVKQLDFMVPTPGVKVKGQLGGYAYVKFVLGSSDVGEGEAEVAAGFQYDTSKTKKEQIDMGDGSFKERDVFDRAAGMQGIVKLRGSLKAAGFGGEVELTGAWNGTDHDYSGTFEAHTLPLPIFIQPGDLKNLLDASGGLSRKYFASIKDENPKTEEEKKGLLKRIKDKVSGWYEKVKPEVDTATTVNSLRGRADELANGKSTPAAGSLSEKIAEKKTAVADKIGAKVTEQPEVGMARIVVGGTLELHRKLGRWKVGGEVHVGTMNETKIELLGMAEASMKKKETIKLQWEA